MRQDNDLAVSLVQSVARIAREAERLFTPKGVTLAQLRVLDLLATRADGVAQHELVKAADTANASAVSSVLRLMEYKNKWLTRNIDRNNRRTWIVKITPLGRRVWRKAISEYHSHVVNRLAPLGDARLLRITTDLTAIRSILFDKTTHILPKPTSRCHPTPVQSNPE